MGGKRIGGIILVIVGIGLAYSGYEMSQSMGGQLNEAISGTSGDGVVIRYVAGAVCVAVGAVLAR
jgi:hypothetical protein